MRGARVSDNELESSNGAVRLDDIVAGIPTTTRRPFQSAVLNDWSLAGGLPGSTARIEAVGSEGRSLRSEPRYTISRSSKIVYGRIELRRDEKGKVDWLWGGLLE